MSTGKGFAEVKEAVEKWWHNLQFERKYSSTNTVQKIINNSPPEIQSQVRQMISEEIKKLVDKCVKSNDLKELQFACNAINGCFDNFMHAIDAVRLSFPEIISFIDYGLAECQIKLNLRTNQKNSTLEVLHSLSRILILVLKLKRTQNVGKVKSNIQNSEGEVNEVYKEDNCKSLLATLTYKIGNFLMMDDILIDTKNNLSMSGILIREILVPDQEKLIQFHKEFVNTIPVSLSDDDCKSSILKFLTCSAIISTWSTNIIDSDSTYIYLKFFISICEKYSSETPVVLNTSRTLLLLIRHESFKKFVNSADPDRKEQIISMLLSCIFMLLEHPVACVRHSAKDFLQLLATHPSLHSLMIDSVFKLPTDKRSYFISIGALANEIGSEILVKNNPELPAQMIAALCDPTIVSHVSLALEFLILRDSLSEKNFSKWCETYIVPLLISLQTVLPIVAADIEKLLEKAFKKCPNSVVYVIDKWSNPTSGEELRYVVTALKISQKQGFKLKDTTVKGSENEKNRNQDGGKELISERLLEHCLHQRDDDIRISAFSLLIEAHKSTKPYSETDFKLIQYFLKYNLNNQQPATRQKILGLIRKMLVRFSESKATFLKPSRDKTEQEEKSKNCLMYDQFLDSLVTFCFSNVFVGCNFNRLNTVLNILLLSFENIREMSFDKEKTNYYWSKFLIALDSSYEENKELATMLTKKLDFSLLDANNPNSAKLLYEKAFNLCTHMEPPDVLTGSYLLQALMNLPSSKQVLSTYFVSNTEYDDVYYNCIQVLMEKLKEQIQLAKLDLMTAATCGPMYGALFAIRLTFKNVDFSTDRVREKAVLEKWGKVINELMQLCFEMTRIVGCVVNSSSPEGHLPMDFQTDVESLLSLNFKNSCEINGSVPSSGRDKAIELIQKISSNFFRKFNKIEFIVESSDCDTYECLRSINALLKENQLLISKTQSLGTQDSTQKLLDVLNNTKSKLQCHLETLQKLNSVIEWPATAQVLLLCAWRSIKEASLFLGDLFTKLPVEKEVELGLLTKSTIMTVGEELKTLLCEIKHRGAFEHAYIGFTHLVNSLWKCSDKNLSNLPKEWLEDIISQLESPLSDQKVKLCSTRRSAGLPFLVQAIICSEVVSLKSTTPSSLHTTMKSLLNITEKGVSQNPESKIHALNVLRALFKHAQLGEHVASYVSKALMVAIRGSRASTWSERNSSSLLFSSLIIRIFGVSRSRDEISKKNRMTSRTFFQRYSELYDFLLSEMELVYSKDNYSDGLFPKPSLYLVLLILGRLYPPPTEDPENIDLSEFLPYINMSRRNPTMKIRELGARALVPLISLDRLKDELDDRFSILSLKSGISQNERHGVLLQIKELLSQSRETLENVSTENLEIKWVENTKWMLDCPKQTSLIILSSYVKVLHILYKTFPSSRQKISELITNVPVSEYLLNLNATERSLFPGISLFLENFYFLKTDIVAYEWLNENSEGWDRFLELFMFMLNCGVSEVQSIPLRIFSHVLKEIPVFVPNSDDDDFSGIGAPMADLLLLQSKEKMKRLQTQILIDRAVLNFLTEHLNSGKHEFFKSVVIHRIWLTVVSTLVMNDVIPISHSNSSGSGLSLTVDFAKALIKSKDKDFSTSALICYAIYLMEEGSIKEGQSMPAEDRSMLADILNEFSSSDADVKERLAVARIMNRCCRNFPGRRMISDPVILKIWMIPFKLLADEDSAVRQTSAELVHRIQEHVAKHVPADTLLMKMKTLDWPHLPLVSLKAQECLLDSYINILGCEHLENLIAQMLIMALSSFSDAEDSEIYSKDEFGVFEKGNPNPFCEDLAFSNLMCRKLTELSLVTDLEALMWKHLDESLAKFIGESLCISDFVPQNLMELVEMVTTVVKEAERKGEFSLNRLQIFLTEIPKFLEGGDVCLFLIMVCSRYPREFRHYETILKRRCLRKLKHNVWERKTKWVLLEIADRHYQTKLLRKHFNLWVVYLNGQYKKKINRRAADALYEEKLKFRGLSVLKRNVEHNWMLMRICKRKFEWNLKYKCWHQWKHYAEKRLKMREVKLLADGIREERLRIRFFYLWLFRYNEKRSLENAYEAAAGKHKSKLTEKYFRTWKLFTTKQTCKMKIRNLAITCYQDKLKEKYIRCWKRYTLQRKRYKRQMIIIQNFYQNYLLKNCLERWFTAFKKLKLDRKIYNLNIASNFYERKLLRKSFKMILKVRETKRRQMSKMEKFREIYVNIYLNYYLALWVEKRNRKMVWNDLEDKATKWRKDFLRETYFLTLVERYQKIIQEREEMANVINYSNSIITHRAFRGWLEVTEKKINKKMELENASKLYSTRLVKNAFEKWKKFFERRCRKKMAARYYRFMLLSRVMDHWNGYFTEKKIKLAEAKKLEEKCNKRLIKSAFDYWKIESEDSKSKQKSASDFYKSLILSKTFCQWKKVTRIKSANKNRYNRNKKILNSILIKNYITQCHEMLSVKRTLYKKLQQVEWKQQKKCLTFHYCIWLKFVNKMKSLRQNVEAYPQLRSDILLEQYLSTLVEALRSKKMLNRKIELAKEAEEKILKRRYLRRWVCFVSWKKDRVLRCVSEDATLVKRDYFEVFVPVGNSTRRKPMIPGYLKADVKYVQAIQGKNMGDLTSSVSRRTGHASFAHRRA